MESVILHAIRALLVQHVAHLHRVVTGRSVVGCSTPRPSPDINPVREDNRALCQSEPAMPRSIFDSATLPSSCYHLLSHPLLLSLKP